ncbi:unnamed protein product [Phytophthora fragariaefolia]|uniref:Unnamed protein product n=1 Tax=Phytophthora fragariaefolia TaxID=1490495 RepID=A0A9W7CX57_9STRA|nr:unnamed protein product [Phytophthora fragariaefolia]
MSRKITADCAATKSMLTEDHGSAATGRNEAGPASIGEDIVWNASGDFVDNAETRDVDIEFGLQFSGDSMDPARCRSVAPWGMYRMIRPRWHEPPPNEVTKRTELEKHQ